MGWRLKTTRSQNKDTTQQWHYTQGNVEDVFYIRSTRKLWNEPLDVTTSYVTCRSIWKDRNLRMKCKNIVDKARLVIKLVCFISICFSSLLFLVIGLDRAQNTKGIEIQTNNLPVETFGFTRKTQQCARLRFVQHDAKQLCSLLLNYWDSQPVSFTLR